MFRNTNDFFEQVYNGNVYDLDISNFIYAITDDEKERLFLLKRDLMFFIILKHEELESKITKEDIKNKLEHYYKNKQEPPIKIWTNHISKKLNERNGNNDLDEESKTLDIEKMFYPNDLFCIRKLENYIDSLINKEEKHTLKKEKNEHIFSNNGYELFEYILQNYISKNTGRYEDLSYYYRRLHTDKFIHQKSTPFKEWFEDTYNEYFSKIKTEIATKNPQRLKNYSIALEWFKSNK